MNFILLVFGRFYNKVGNKFMFPVNEIFLAFLQCVDVKIVQKVNKFRLHLDVAPKDQTHL